MRRSLALLATSGLLPLVALSAIFGTLTLRDERHAVEDQAHTHAQFAATLIADRLAADMREMRVIAQSPLLDGGPGADLHGFATMAARIVAQEPGWKVISVADPSGRRLVDVPQPIDGEPHGRVIDEASLRLTVASGRTQIGHVLPGRKGIFAFAVRAPVIRDGRVTSIVSAIVPAASLADLLAFEPLPPGWRAGIVDGAGYVVASTAPSETVAPRRASPEALTARNTGVQGLYRFTRRDGTPAAAVFVPVPWTDWSVHVSTPASLYTGPARQAILLLAGATILCLLLFLVLARLMVAELRQFRAREAAALQSQRMEALGQLTGGVAHDFNNLLTPIIGGLDLLRLRVGDDDKAQRYVEGAMASAERARALVGRLLSFSRRQTLAPRDLDVAALIEGLSDLIHRSMPPAITLRVEVADALPTARADPGQLELAILNLAINARDAMPDGGEIVLSANEADREAHAGLPPGRYVAIAITDRGLGMDEATLRQAVDPFFTTKSADKGTGLGLSMVHGFAGQSGGLLRLTSRPGAGTVATILLPAGANLPTEAKAAPPTRPADGRRVLLVDDDPAVRAATAEMLAEHGNAVVEAEGVDQALALLRETPNIDAIVTDYLMPGRSGADLIRVVRRERPDMPVLLITGYISISGDVPADVTVLAKPFRAEELLAGLAGVLETARQ